MSDKNNNLIKIDPVHHATMILNWGGLNIYVDPVNEKEQDMFLGKPTADLILITDIHHDHFDVETLHKIIKDKTVVVAPKAVADLMPPAMKSITAIMMNGEMADHLGFKIEAIPMYNLPETEKSFHTKGRGNGYVIEKNGTRIYVSGDTSGIPEMRSLRDIDIAFVCMNLPYTMDVNEASDAVLAFNPIKVYPYHYRQNPTNDFADVEKFKEIVEGINPEIEVVQLDWYPKS